MAAIAASPRGGGSVGVVGRGALKSGGDAEDGGAL